VASVNQQPHESHGRRPSYVPGHVIVLGGGQQEREDVEMAVDSPATASVLAASRLVFGGLGEWAPLIRLQHKLESPGVLNEPAS
jgi:hypothetical protein